MMSVCCNATSVQLRDSLTNSDDFVFFFFFISATSLSTGVLVDVIQRYPLSRLRILSFPLTPLFLLKSNCFVLWLYSGYVSY